MDSFGKWNYARFFAVSVNCGCWVSVPKWLTIIRHCRTLFSQARSSEPQAFVGAILEPGTCMLGKTMSITVQLDLPEAVAAEAKAKGLLTPQELTRLLEQEIQRDKPVQDFRQMVEQMRAYPDEPMTMDEIQAVVNEVRAERRARREGSR